MKAGTKGGTGRTRELETWCRETSMEGMSDSQWGAEQQKRCPLLHTRGNAARGRLKYEQRRGRGVLRGKERAIAKRGVYTERERVCSPEGVERP